MKSRIYKAFAAVLATITCLCACSPTPDSSVERSTQEHFSISEAVVETQPASSETVHEETEGIKSDAFDPTACSIDGFDDLTLNKAAQLMGTMSLEQKVAQMFLIRCPESDADGQITAYCPGGLLLFGRDFEDKTSEQVIEDISTYQSAASVPMFIAVDEEGGTVNRISTNPLLRMYPFWSPQELFAEGGMELISSDTLEKAQLLKSLGINLNMAPVCDISTDPQDFIYARSFGQDAEQTSEYVSTVVRVMNENQLGSVLKHFPGYGNNTDTHQGTAVDTRSYDIFTGNDFLPFKAGIDQGASAVLVSHTLVLCMDEENPASLSPKVHDILRSELGFNGLIMTDDLSMEAITGSRTTEQAAIDAVLAGNDILCSTDYAVQIPAVIEAVKNGTISEDRIDYAVMRILAMKMQLGIIQ